MKRSLLPVLAACLFASALAAADDFGSSSRPEFEKEKNGPHGECKSDWQMVQKGLDYRAITCLGDEDDLDLHVFRMDPSVWDLDTAFMRESRARDVAREQDASFVINANFFDRQRNPEGLLVRSGTEIRASRPASWQAIFLLTRSGKAKIVPVSKWPSYKKSAWMAVQSGPRLVIGGHTSRVHQSYAAARAGVCIQKDGSLLFFASPTDRKLDMYEIGRVTRRGEEDGGLRCQEAMLFDGGHSAQIYVQGMEKTLSFHSDPVPAFVIARPRPATDTSGSR